MDKFTEIRRILIVILFLNWIVALSKVIYGIRTRCASMIADGVHSFGDGASNIIGLIGIWAASKPKDESHPYGHKKFETFATLGIAVILFVAAFNIFRNAFLRIFHPVVPDVTSASFIVMFVTLIINIFSMRYEHRKGRELSSDILICDSLHTKTDIYASIVVIATLISIKSGFVFFDTIIAGVIALLIARSGFDILRDSSNVLCDRNVISCTAIEGIVKGMQGIKSVHNIRTRGRKDDVHVDIHIVIDKNTHVDAAHNLSHNIENVMKDKIKGITEVDVHIEPSV